MQVFLVRHADAVAETRELRDAHRPLTARGRIQARALGDRLRWHDCHPTCIWSSPLVRAVQTAELVERGLDCMVPIEILPALVPDGPVHEVADVLARIAQAVEPAVVLIVGHEPSLSTLGSLLAPGPDLPALSKAQAARIVDGVLRWRFAWDDDAPALVGVRGAW